ncbi:serine hydrolase domain-containing protein [Niabella beijingensis]|uniref:serine hydrolase domain-containing protein n=1 Tax=Niabella beijingensis TaxID=2872700 RepID=UPI001CBB5FC8|nr:serine hydrolase domain-containing protein [Niabella beijingensis]MBZ4189593.1 beta-lactamase family protein [Niabella beijingensis]
MRYPALTILVLFLYILRLPAQEFDRGKLDAYFDTLGANHLFMGSVMLARNGTPVYKRSVGYRNVKTGAKNNDSTLYHIGSISKTFTAALVLKAAEAGLVDTGATIAKFFPEIKNSDRITIAQLLRHRSGIANFTSSPSYRLWSTKPCTGKQLLDTIIAGGSDFEPGSKMAYSNSNYVLLTFILENIYHQSYAGILEKQIISPLKLERTVFGGKIDDARNDAHSYSYKEGWQPEPETDLSIPLGAGAIKSTPADLSRLVHALFGGNLVSPATLSRMQTAQDGAGIGMFPMTLAEKKGWGHTGGIDGFRSVYVYFPEDAVCLAVFANGDNYNLNTVAAAAVKAFYNLPFEIPEFSVFPVTEAELKPYTGNYTSAEVPLKITISTAGNVLQAHPTNQPVYTMRTIAKNKFRHDPTNVELEFNTTDGTMILLQNGHKVTFKKEIQL